MAAAVINIANRQKSFLDLLDRLDTISLEHKKLVKTKLGELSKKKSDPFLANENLINLRAWYETKNPDYKKLSELPELSIPEHEHTALNMIHTILSLLSSRRFSKKNITNVSSNNKYYGSNSFQLANSNITENPEQIQNAKILLIRLIDYITTGYIYQKFFNIVISYILFFSTGRIELNDEDKTLKLSKYLKLYDSFFIIYPTTGQINFTKVVLFMNAPFVNFRCSTKRYRIHGTYHSPVIDMIHDLSHCDLTHGVGVITYKDDKKSTYTFYHPYNRGADPVVTNYIIVLNNINMLISALYPYISYDYKIISDFIKKPSFQHTDITIEIKKEISKFVLSWLLFTYFHERAVYNVVHKKFVSKIYEKQDRTVKELINEIQTLNETVIRDVKELIEGFQNYKKLFFIASGAKSFEEFDNVFLNDIINADVDYAGNIIQFGLSILPEDLNPSAQVSSGGFINKKRLSRTKHIRQKQMKINTHNTKKKLNN